MARQNRSNRSGFNAATTRESWKVGSGGFQKVISWGASTQPRLVSRGKVDVEKGTKLIDVMLQRSHDS